MNKCSDHEGLNVQLSLVIPAYNEEHRIGLTLGRVARFFADCDMEVEIVVINDGSTDKTVEVVEKHRAAHHIPIVLVDLGENRGKGYAVRTGMGHHARGAVRAFMDADGSTPIEEIIPAMEAIKKGADVVIGSRALKDSQVRVKQAWYRQNMGRIFNLFLRGLKLTHFKDTQCGFKVFTEKACDIIFHRQTIDHFSFDAELLYIAVQHDLNVVEMPVQWYNSPLSRVHPLYDAIGMFWDLLVIRWRALRGQYR